MSYHRLKIHKHSVDSPFKILEEAIEYIDSLASNNKIMAIQELSDLYGCIENEIHKHNLDIKDLKIMSDTTKRVFSYGSRVSPKLLPYLKSVHDSIISYGLGFIQVKCGNINYNFYHDDIEKFETNSFPHNHQQDYVSEILQGTLTEYLYQTSIGIPDKSFKAYCGCGTSEDIKHLDYKLSDTLIYSQGDIYSRLSSEYHSVQGIHGTITKVVKFGDKSDAFVISNEELKSTESLPPDVLWSMLENFYLP